MKRVLHQEWLEKWLAGEEIEFKSIGSSEFKQFSNSYTLDMFEDATYTFRTPPKLMTIDADDMLQFLNDNTWAGDVQANKVIRYLKDLLAKQSEIEDKQESGNE